MHYNKKGYSDDQNRNEPETFVFSRRLGLSEGIASFAAEFFLHHGRRRRSYPDFQFGTIGVDISVPTLSGKTWPKLEKAGCLLFVVAGGPFYLFIFFFFVSFFRNRRVKQTQLRVKQRTTDLPSFVFESFRYASPSETLGSIARSCFSTLLSFITKS